MMQKPSEKEQEYFLKTELERLAQLREEHRKKAQAEELTRRKELHWLHCPKCGDDMTVSHLGGIEVEVCPDCGGIYLDAGELDKVLEERQQGPFASAMKKVRAIWE